MSQRLNVCSDTGCIRDLDSTFVKVVRWSLGVSFEMNTIFVNDSVIDSCLKLNHPAIHVLSLSKLVIHLLHCCFSILHCFSKLFWYKQYFVNVKCKSGHRVSDSSQLRWRCIIKTNWLSMSVPAPKVYFQGCMQSLKPPYPPLKIYLAQFNLQYCF